MAVQDTTIQANVNNYFFKTRADYEAHASEILNNSTIYIESDGEYGNVKMNLLWENPSPSSSFAAQVITTLDMNEYGYILYLFNTNTTSSENGGLSYISPNGKGCYCSWSYGNTSHGRECNYISSTQIQFTNGVTNTSNDNTMCIPTKIYGLKIVPVSDSSGGGSQVSIVDWSLGGNA